MIKNIGAIQNDSDQNDFWILMENSNQTKNFLSSAKVGFLLLLRIIHLYVTINLFSGKRSCVGMSLAKMTTFLIVTSLIQKFEFRFAPGFEPFSNESIPGGAISEVPYHKMIISPRNNNH